MLAFVSMSGYQDSNLGPPAPKAGALTGLRYTPKKTDLYACFCFYVGVPGFEPGTPCSQSRCANRTALHPVFLKSDAKVVLLNETTKHFCRFFISRTHFFV